MTLHIFTRIVWCHRTCFPLRMYALGVAHDGNGTRVQQQPVSVHANHYFRYTEGGGWQDDLDRQLRCRRREDQAQHGLDGATHSLVPRKCGWPLSSQILHAHRHVLIQRPSVAYGGVDGVRRRVVPHRSGRGRRADRGGLAAEEIGDAAQGVHTTSLSHRRSSRNQSDGVRRSGDTIPRVPGTPCLVIVVSYVWCRRNQPRRAKE